MRVRHLIPLLVALVLGSAATAPGALANGGSGSATLEPASKPSGSISGSVPLSGMNVVLMAASPGGTAPVSLGSARSGQGGQFTLDYRGNQAGSVKYLLATRPGGAAEAGFPVPGQSYRLAAALGEGAVPSPVKVTERTTVAMGYAMAQFVGAGDRVAGASPGLGNAAAMSGDLVDLGSGLSSVLRNFPNGKSNTTLPTFDSLANLLALCRHQTLACKRALSAAGAPGAGHAPDTLAAVVDIARNPWHDAAGLGRLALAAPARWTPALGEGKAPKAWTLALSFEGDPPGLDGPGNFAIDKGGNLWVANNYAYSRQSRVPACFSDKVFRFTPTGQTYPGSPYVGGGLSGVGFGTTIDPQNRVWLGNFGFEGKGCEEPADHFSVSTFSASGRTLSPPDGWRTGELNWPQGTISDRSGQIWVANCGNDSVTRIDPAGALSPTSSPPPALNFDNEALTAGSPLAFERPFADALNAKGEVFVTGNASASVLRLSPQGKPLSLVTGGGLHLPMGIAGDSNGYMWVSNSKWVVAPCPGVRSSKQVSEEVGKGGGDVTLLKPNGKIAPGSPITGGGLDNPWGIAVDADDHVWVANFGGQRLSELCGTDPETCPPGKRGVGAAISPKSGYGFDGLVRSTGVAVDPSGNVWLTNNWKKVPIQTNPGGYQIVAYLGIATPTAAPQIGPPQHP